VVFGEDLGTVPDDFRNNMSAWEMMGYSIYLIERTASGELVPLNQVRELAITAYSNHDFPTLCGFWSGKDFVWRERLGIGDDPSILSHEKAVRTQDKSTLSHLAGLDGAPQTLSATDVGQLQAWLAHTPSLAFAVQLDDVMLEPAQHNIPGTTDEQPNWRRRSKYSLEEMISNSDCAHIFAAIDAARNEQT
jgi:4-alpha-glucanotransferase